MTTSFNEAQQIITPDIRGRCIFKRVIIEEIVFHHMRVKDNLNTIIQIIHQSKRCNRPRRDPQNLFEKFRLGETEPPRTDNR